MSLTDKRRKKIIADYIEIGTYTGAARRNKVSVNTVKNLVNRDPEVAKKCNQKKEKNTADILAFMETKKEAVCELIDTYMQALVDPDKVEKATVNQLSTALGTVIDKFTMGATRPPDTSLFASIMRYAAKPDDTEANDE